MIPRFAVLLLILTSCLTATDGGHIVLIGDDHAGSEFRSVRRPAAAMLRKQGIRMIATGKRGLTAADLRSDLDREVLRYQPSRVVLGVGAHDVWDFRAEAAIGDGAMDAAIGHIQAIVEQLGAASAEVILVTPPAFGPEVPELQATMTALATALRSLAESADLQVIDIHQITAVEGAFRRGGLQMERAITDDLVATIVDALGLTETNLPSIRPPGLVLLFTNGLKTSGNFYRSGVPWEIMEPFQEHTGQELRVLSTVSVEDLAAGPMAIGRHEPAVVILFNAHDEIIEDRPVDRYIEHTRQAIAHTRGLGIQHIMLATPLPMNHRSADKDAPFDPRGRGAQSAAAHAAAITALGRELGVPVIDVYSEGLRYALANPKSSFSGSRSISGRGLVIFTDILRQIFQLPPREE